MMKKRNKRRVQTDQNIKTGQKYKVTAEGSLGLLAVGYQGLVLWRDKIREAKQTENIN